MTTDESEEPCELAASASLPSVSASGVEGSRRSSGTVPSLAGAASSMATSSLVLGLKNVLPESRRSRRWRSMSLMRSTDSSAQLTASLLMATRSGCIML
eukprot:11197433-Lingulodinium_polyedra.AAC.1